MSFYESVFIARQDISASQVETLTKEFSDIVAELGGRVANSEYWGLRTLAYRVRKNRKGHYVMLNMDCPGDAISELERRMRLNEDVLRYLTIKVEELSEEQSIMMTQKGNDKPERGERGDRGDRGGRGDRGDRGGRRERHDRDNADNADAAPAADA